MPEGSDEIFVLNQGELRSVPLRPMRAGLLGRSLEEALQTLFEEYPAIIPGTQIDPASEDPPRFALLRREMPVGGWSLDHLYIDQFGVLTLVETKLLQNPESRREVVAQIIEYAANARAAWGSGAARQLSAEFWSKREKDLDDVLRESLPNSDIDQLWRDVESNLEMGRIRLIVAADSIRPEVRRMIEYLNSEMENAEVLGLELRVYGEDEGQIILAPRIIGQTQALADRRTPLSGGIIWSANRLREAFQDLPTEEASPLNALLDWATISGCFLESRAQSPNFGLAGRGGDRILGVSHSGALYLFFEEHRYPDGCMERDRLVDELKELALLAPDIEPEEVVSGRTLIRKLSELDQGEFDKLLGLFRSYCRTQDGSA
jgi:hypothetical protein